MSFCEAWHVSYFEFIETYTEGQIVVLAALSSLLHPAADEQGQGEQKKKDWRPPGKKPPKKFSEMTADEYERYLQESGL